NREYSQLIGGGHSRRHGDDCDFFSDREVEPRFDSGLLVRLVDCAPPPLRFEYCSYEKEEQMTRLAMAVVALAIVPTIAAAQTDSSRMRGADSTRARPRRQQTSAGSIGRASGNYGLTHDQITQLQTALKQND